MNLENPFSTSELDEVKIDEATPEMNVKGTFNGIRTISRFNEEHVAPVVQGQLALNKREQAFETLFFRVHGLVHSLTRLNSLWDAQAITAISRSVFELVVDMRVLHRDVFLDGVERFHEFTNAERLRVAKKVVNFVDANPSAAFRPIDSERKLVGERADEIESRAKALWNTAEPSHWSGRDLRARSRDVDVEARYVRYFYMQSAYVHSGAAGFYGMTYESFHSLVSTSHMVVQQDVCDSLEVMGKELKLESAIDGWSVKLDFLRSLPSLFVVDYLRQRRGLPRKLFVGIDAVDGIA